MHRLKFISLLSGGIDSPVAAHMVARRGNDGILLNMDNRPLASDEEYIKVDTIADILKGIHRGRLRTYRVPYGKPLQAIVDLAEPRYRCVLCKRGMLRIADLLCERMKGEAIVLGDSIGQVASQTLDNLSVVSAGVKHPVLRPLIGFDKVEIEAIAKEIGTYAPSHVSTVGCTAAPRHPSIGAGMNRLAREAERVGLEIMVKEAVNHIHEVG